MSSANELAAMRTELASLRFQLRLLFRVVLVAVATGALLAWRWHSSWQCCDVNEARAVQVEAQEYHLLDPDGKLRGMWRCPPAGPSWTMLDEHGRLLVEVRQATGSGTVRVLDGEGRVAMRTIAPFSTERNQPGRA